MTLSSPIWLWLLAPWLVVAVWLFTGLRDGRGVPHLPFWKGPSPLPKPRVRLHRPPISILIFLLAALLGILAGAKPSLRRAGNGEMDRLVVLIDKSPSMMATRNDGRPRWQALRDEVMPAAGKLFGEGIDERALQKTNLPDFMADPKNRVVLLSDRSPGIVNDRLVWVAPSDEIDNVQIVSATSARTPGATQLMVTLRNDSAQSRAALRVGEISKAITLPPRGEEENYFVDLPGSISSAKIFLDLNDAQPLDNVFEWTTGASPRIELAGSPPESVGRMVRVYSEVHPPGGEVNGEGSSVVISADSLPPERAGILLAPGEAASPAAIQVVDHPITAHVDFSILETQPLRRSGLMPPHFSPIVRAGDSPLIGIDEPRRRIWIGFDSDAFAKDPAFVVLWTNALDWIGKPSSPPPPRSVPANPEANPTWRTQLAGLTNQNDSHDVSPIIALGALALLIPGVILFGARK